MVIGGLYFVKDEFYDRFEKYGLLSNKGEQHGRPCCYVFKINKDDNIYWMIPASTRVEKYEALYNHSIQKYGICDNIDFGYIRGHKNAFLPQNMFPILEKYVNNPYIDTNTNKPIIMPKDFVARINAKARKNTNIILLGKNLV